MLVNVITTAPPLIRFQQLIRLTAAHNGACNTNRYRVTTGSWDGAGEAALNGMADGALSGAITGAITGGMNSNVCFIAGTVVLSSAGFVAIETIRAGDKVWAENPETGQKELKEVVQTFVNETEHLVHVFVNGEEVITTPEHPFYSPVKGWTAACELRAGDILVSVNGEYVVVEKIQNEILETPITVYNFEVEDFHTYYVGKGALLVHNICGGNSSSSGVGGKGFNSYRQLKKEIGSPGVGNEWHHIVEQSQIAKSGFSPQMIQNTNNIMSISKTTHQAISGYYSSVQPFTNGMIVRNWLAGQSFSAHHR